MIGIYLIINTETGRMYVGSSIDIELRFYMHCHYLSSNEHANYRLQRAWNFYGADAFHFCIVEECNKEDLLKIEQLWIDATERKYNINPIAGNTLGRKHSEATIEKIRKSKIGLKYSKESSLKKSLAIKGRPKTLEHKLKIGKGNSKSDKWPHGSKCKCRECSDKHNLIYKTRPSYKRKLASHRSLSW